MCCVGICSTYCVVSRIRLLDIDENLVILFLRFGVKSSLFKYVENYEWYTNVDILKIFSRLVAIWRRCIAVE